MDWRSVPSAPAYKVRADGAVLGVRGAILRPSQNEHGYMQVRVHGVTRKVHHLVAEAFIGPRPPGREINHIDCNKQNNAAGNLEYVTRSENMLHARDHGLVGRGRGGGRPSRFSPKQVAAMKLARLSGDLTREQIQRRFKISHQHFYAITNGKRCLPKNV